jgi:hypothetical protein
VGGRPVSLNDDDCLLGRRAGLLVANQAASEHRQHGPDAQDAKGRRRDVITHYHRFPAVNRQQADEDDTGAG